MAADTESMRVSQIRLSSNLARKDQDIISIVTIIQIKAYLARKDQEVEMGLGVQEGGVFILLGPAHRPGSHMTLMGRGLGSRAL